eukprot:gene25754-29096_t
MANYGSISSAFSILSSIIASCCTISGAGSQRPTVLFSAYRQAYRFSWSVPECVDGPFGGLPCRNGTGRNCPDDSFIERAEINTDPAFPPAPVRVTARVLAALQQPSGSLRYTPRAFLWLRFINSEQLGMAAGAVGLTPELFFNAAMLLKFEATRVGEEGEAERLLLRQYVTAHVSAEALALVQSTAFLSENGWKNLPLKSLHVQGEFFDSFGEVIVRQVWTNHESSPITSKYKFSLDSSAVVSGFQMKIGNQAWVGVVKAKDAAKAEFNNAVASGIKSSILEKISDNEYQVEIGPIPPSETAEIEFHYLTHAAVQLDGSYRFVLPTNIARKYSGSRNANQADKEYAAKMASTPYASQPPYTFDVDLTWRTGSALRGI